MSTTILLTATVNVQAKPIIYQRNKQERLNTYLKAIRQWLTKTNFKIVLVENSGYTFPELQQEKEIFKDRFEIIYFQESQVKEAKYLETLRALLKDFTFKAKLLWIFFGQTGNLTLFQHLVTLSVS